MNDSPGPPDPRLEGLAERLLRLSRQDTIHWTRGRESVDQFKINLTDSAVRLRSFGRSRDMPHRTELMIEVLNHEEIIIETIRPNSDDEYELLAELYELARRQALNIDSTIDSLIRELSGKDESKPEQP